MNDNQAHLAADNTTWQTFRESPVRFIGPHSLGACLGDLADEATQRSLAQHPRFQQRLTQRLIRHYALPPPETLPVPEADDLPLFLLRPEDGETLMRYCGAICHAMAFVREIRAPRVIELKTRFGEALFAAALANRELAIDDLSYHDDEALQQAMLRDGGACVTTWLARQPEELAAWLRLGLAHGLPPLANELPTEIRQRGATIVRRATAAILADTAEKTA